MMDPRDAAPTHHGHHGQHGVTPLRPPPRRLIAVSPSGDIVAARKAIGLRVIEVRSQPVAERQLTGTIADFGFCGETLWLAEGSTVRTARDQPGRQGWTLHAAVSALRTSHSVRDGFIACCDKYFAWVSTTDPQPPSLIPGLPPGAVVVPIPGPCVVAGFNGTLLVTTIGGRTMAQFDLARGDTILDVWPVFAGQWIAVLVRHSNAEHEFLILSQTGVLRQRHPIQLRPQQATVAEDRGIAVCLHDGGAQSVLDLRFGKRECEMRSAHNTDEIAISSSGKVVFAGCRVAGADISVEAAVIDGIDGAGDAARDAVVPQSTGFSSVDIALPPTTLVAESEEDPAPAPAPEMSSAESLARSRALVDEALCHIALVLERLFYLSRHLGLLPRTTSSDDPLGALVITDSDVATILAGFKKYAETAPEARGSLVADPFRERLAASRAALRKRLSDRRNATCGLARLVNSFGLDEDTTDALLLCVAPDWDLRIGRMIGFLNNDATQMRPRFAHLVLAVRGASPSVDAEILRKLNTKLFSPGLLRRDASGDTPLVLQVVRADDQVVDLGVGLLSEPEDSVALTWQQLRWHARDKRALRWALRRELQRESNYRMIILEGIRGSGRTTMARATASELGMPLEICNLAKTHLTTPEELLEEIHRASVRARVTRRVLLVRSEGVIGRSARVVGSLAQLITNFSIPCFVLVRPGELESVDPAIAFVRFEPPPLGRDDRLELWRESFTRKGLEISVTNLDDIAGRYECPPGRVLEIADEVAFRREGLPRVPIEVADVRETMRELTVQRLRSLATRYESAITLNDLLFPGSVVARLEELVFRIRHRHRVLSSWNFADKAHESYGVSALFVGPPGTGKTAAAAAICNSLQIDLYIVDFSSIMSKWLGETEQNLAKIFDEAQASSVALLFDEADALFGKRSANQESASDRYANVTINYLLQRMESFSGLAILTTNLEKAMDDAFQRRITSKIRFPEIDDKLRRELWNHMLPRNARYASDVDLGELSEENRLQGAHIRRALTRAAFRAAADGREEPLITGDDLRWAASAEYEDLGRLVLDEKPPGER